MTVKTAPPAYDKATLAKKFVPFSRLEIKAPTEGGPGRLEGYLSVFGNVDSQGDVVMPGAFAKTLEWFIDRGMLTWGHDWDVNIGTIDVAREDDHGLWIEADFHSDSESQKYRTRVQERLARGKTMGLSIGYGIADGGMEQTQQGARLLTDLILFEGGLVVYGANDAALVAETKALRAEVESKGAIRPHKSDTSEGAWDGTATWARLPAEKAKLRAACAWIDPDGDPDTKAAYKFIHHEVSSAGEVGAANLTACSSGIGVLNGGRGGTTIPDADRQGVYSHLAGHLKDADREPPELLKAEDVKKAAAPAATKILLPLDLDEKQAAVSGSFEERQERLYQALRERYSQQANPSAPAPAPGMAPATSRWFVWPVATFLNRVIVQLEPWSEGAEARTVEVEYEMADGAVTLGAERDVELQTTVIPKGMMLMSGKGTPFDDHAERVRVALSEWVARCKAGSAEKAKEGRAISQARRDRLATLRDALRSGAEELDGLLSETEPRKGTDAQHPVSGALLSLAMRARLSAAGL